MFNTLPSSYVPPSTLPPACTSIIVPTSIVNNIQTSTFIWAGGFSGFTTSASLQTILNIKSPNGGWLELLYDKATSTVTGPRLVLTVDGRKPETIDHNPANLTANAGRVYVGMVSSTTEDISALSFARFNASLKLEISADGANQYNVYGRYHLT